MRIDGKYSYPELSSRHLTKATNILKRLSHLATIKGFKVLEDDCPYHTLIKLSNNEVFSVYNSGFNDRMDLQLLTKTGDSNKKYKERSYITMRGIFDYLKKRESKNAV